MEYRSLKLSDILEEFPEFKSQEITADETADLFNKVSQKYNCRITQAFFNPLTSEKRFIIIEGNFELQEQFKNIAELLK